jgi:hypothetical protein
MYSPKWLFVFPGAVLMCLGAVLAATLWDGPLQLKAGMVLDVNSFVAGCFMLITGVQVPCMGVLTRYYASFTGMLPLGRRSEWVLRTLTTDRVVTAAAVLLLLGLVVFGSAIVQWLQGGLGNLTSPHVPRAVVAGLSLIVIGSQLGFGAFMIGILEIPLIQKGFEPPGLATNTLRSAKPKQ